MSEWKGREDDASRARFARQHAAGAHRRRTVEAEVRGAVLVALFWATARLALKAAAIAALGGLGAMAFQALGWLR